VSKLAKPKNAQDSFTFCAYKAWQRNKRNAP